MMDKTPKPDTTPSKPDTKEKVTMDKGPKLETEKSPLTKSSKDNNPPVLLQCVKDIDTLNRQLKELTRRFEARFPEPEHSNNCRMCARRVQLTAKTCPWCSTVDPLRGVTTA